MPLSRLILPLFLACALLSAQHGGAAHALGHALEQALHQDKQVPHSPACEQCADYAQLGSALSVSAYRLPLAAAAGEAVLVVSVSFRSAQVFAAAARGPPASVQKIA
jgi:hypothetical protein